MKKEILDLKKERRNIKKLVISQRNMLDELEIQTAAYEEAVVAVEGLLEDDYSVDDIKSLKSGLNHVQIKGDPKTSIRRLVEGLTKHKNLCTLEERVGIIVF